MPKSFHVIVDGSVSHIATTPAQAANRSRAAVLVSQSVDTDLVPHESYLLDRIVGLVPGEGTVINSAAPRIVVKRVDA